MQINIKYDLRSAPFGPPLPELYSAFLEQCRWADGHGFAGVRLHEHHRSVDDYLPSPVVMAGAVAAVTERLQIRCSVIVLPLHDPVRIAEDLAVVDNVSRGRLEVVVAAGYNRPEFEMFGREIDDRVTDLETGVVALRHCWTGEEFEFQGRPVLVRPRPFGNRQIPIAVGGSSARAAKQAARIGDGCELVPYRFVETYRRERAALGKDEGWIPGPGHQLRMVHVSKDPDETWQRIAPFALHENNDYVRMTSAAGTSVGYLDVGGQADELRAQGIYRVVTPDEAIALARSLGLQAEFQLHPLMGGMDIDLSWESLELFESEVMPVLRADGLL
jgi:alkanesulfonate monooxygenase SsuD/methylene tetrahydromethanopterin reductase-like flavin-dependent oxidoreductase (luciferase family)